MSRLELTKKLMRRWFTSIPFFILLGLVLGGLLSAFIIPKPNVAIITISDAIISRNTLMIF